MSHDNQNLATVDISSLPPEERASQLLKFDENKPKLTALAKQSERIKEITNAAGREECHSAYMVLKTTRVAIAKDGKEARDDANKFAKAVIAKENELIRIIQPEEERLQLIRDEWDNRIERERLARLEEERLRVENIKVLIQKMRELPQAFYGKPSAGIEIKLQFLRELVLDPNLYEEFLAEMQDAHKAAMFSLADMLERQRAQEAEQERLRAIEEENTRMREKMTQMEREAEEARQREAQRAREEDERAEKIERVRVAELERVEREERERQEANERERQRIIREVEEAKQRKEASARQRELDAQAEANRKKSEELEAQRISNLSIVEAANAVVKWFCRQGAPDAPECVWDLAKVLGKIDPTEKRVAAKPTKRMVQ